MSLRAAGGIKLLETPHFSYIIYCPLYLIANAISLIADKQSKAYFQQCPPGNVEKENPGTEHPYVTPDADAQDQQKPDPKDVISLDSLDILDQVTPAVEPEI